MKSSVLTFMFSFLLLSCYAQEMQGTWVGVLSPLKMDKRKGMFYSFGLTHTFDLSLVKAESYDGKSICLKKGTIKNPSPQQVIITESIITQKSRTNVTNWCKYTITLYYDTISGFWIGKYESTDCANQRGEAIFYRSDVKWNADVNISSSKQTFDYLVNLIEKGKPAPDKQMEDRKNFSFQSIYFDFDKDNLKQEYLPYLSKMGELIEGHSDIRIKITGHTDAKGSDQYNDGLSQRRARSIEGYFNSIGIPTHRLIFDFKGERLPAASNDNDAGRQLNRRVDFEFIYE